ncbi:MAG: SAM-dependent methyltransferase [Actinomycetota bacterium]|nr:SAM-dependent methyltransferase [Actinomycetota bacterium]
MTSLPNSKIEPASFRDPSGFLFTYQGKIYRQVNNSYKQDYDLLMTSGLYQKLTELGLLIPHQEAGIAPAIPGKAYKIIEPEPIPFISYPYEWCFGQLKEAALVTLTIQKIAMDYGMTLKDCSAYNIQFKGCSPVFIDTLSFEKYRPGQIWVPYRQACQHFIAPLALMCYRDIRLNQLLRINLDGIPLDLASELLPWSTRFNFPLLSHIHLHAKSQKHFADKKVEVGKRKISKLAFMGLTESLLSLVKKLKVKGLGTEWADYYQDTNYSKKAFNHKQKIVEDMLIPTNSATLWDFGANDGLFSRIGSSKKIYTISMDMDYGAVEKNYSRGKANKEAFILPLLMDLSNPSPGNGWENKERKSLAERGPADTILALALIHHLAISNNLPLGKIASLFRHCCRYLIIEFVPKDDSQVKRLLATREDIFSNYHQQAFEHEFSQYFIIKGAEAIADSKRTVYLMENKETPV